MLKIELLLCSSTELLVTILVTTDWTVCCDISNCFLSSSISLFKDPISVSNVLFLATSASHFTTI